MYHPYYLFTNGDFIPPVVLDNLFGGVAHFKNLHERSLKNRHVEIEQNDVVSEQVQEIVAEVAKAVLIDTDAEQRQALKDALEAQKIAFKQAYFDALKRQLIREYMLAAEYRRIAIKNEQDTIVFMMMALA